MERRGKTVRYRARQAKCPIPNLAKPTTNEGGRISGKIHSGPLSFLAVKSPALSTRNRSIALNEDISGVHHRMLDAR